MEIKTERSEELTRILKAGAHMSFSGMLQRLGWQGGTIHQVSEITGLSVSFLLDAQK